MPETAVVAPGMLVALTYSIRDEQGRILEQTDLPMTYIQGGHQELIGGMDRAVSGQRAGDQVEFALEPDDAGFGDYDPGLTFTDAIDNVPPQFRMLGAEVPMQSESGHVRTFHVTRIENGKLTVDGNHPLAGKRLFVALRITEVREPTAEERARDAATHPHPH